jgi:hypothetical protein
MTTATATMISRQQANDSYREHVYRVPLGGQQLGVAYYLNLSGRHVIIEDGEMVGDREVYRHATVEEARARWAKIVAGWKAKGYVLIRTRTGRDSKAVSVKAAE